MHNSSRRKHEREFIGLFGTQVGFAEVVDLPSDKRAVVTRVGGVAIAMNHFRNQHIGTDREHQARAIVDYLKHDDQAVIMGDFNAVPHEKARRIIRKAGFVSVFKAMRQGLPNTFPTDPYWDIFVTKPPQPRYCRGPVSLDDIYVRGAHVEAAGMFEGNSDHAGLWARIRTAA
jgi:endonuclease/exonuclease/phosphatase family metal-dependent hydrolase